MENQNGKKQDGQFFLKDSLFEKVAPGPGRRIALIVAIVLIVAGAITVYMLYFSPWAQVKRTAREMGEALEQKDADLLLGYFSKDYEDAAGNMYEDMETLLHSKAFGLIEDIEIDIEEVKVVLKGRDSAIASLKGRISYKVKDFPVQEKYNEDPLLISFRREGKEWKVTAVENMDIAVVDLEAEYEDIIDMF